MHLYIDEVKRKELSEIYFYHEWIHATDTTVRNFPYFKALLKLNLSDCCDSMWFEFMFVLFLEYVTWNTFLFVSIQITSNKNQSLRYTDRKKLCMELFNILTVWVLCIMICVSTLFLPDVINFKAVLKEHRTADDI